MGEDAEAVGRRILDLLALLIGLAWTNGCEMAESEDNQKDRTPREPELTRSFGRPAALTVHLGSGILVRFGV